MSSLSGVIPMVVLMVKMLVMTKKTLATIVSYYLWIITSRLPFLPVLPTFKDFLVPQRDRAFSWDTTFENDLHSELHATSQIPSEHPTHSSQSDGTQRRTRLPSFGDSRKGLFRREEDENEEISEADILKDPLLMTIPSDLLLDNAVLTESLVLPDGKESLQKVLRSRSRPSTPPSSSQKNFTSSYSRIYDSYSGEYRLKNWISSNSNY